MRSGFGHCGVVRGVAGSLESVIDLEGSEGDAKSLERSEGFKSFPRFGGFGGPGETRDWNSP